MVIRKLGQATRFMMLIAFCVLAACSLAGAQHKAAKVKPGCNLKDVNFRSHVFGPEVNAESLLGKYVLVNVGGA